MDLKSEKTESFIQILYFNVPYQLKRMSDIQVEVRIVKAELPKLRILVMYQLKQGCRSRTVKVVQIMEGWIP